MTVVTHSCNVFGLMILPFVKRTFRFEVSLKFGIFATLFLKCNHNVDSIQSNIHYFSTFGIQYQEINDGREKYRWIVYKVILKSFTDI